MGIAAVMVVVKEGFRSAIEIFYPYVVPENRSSFGFAGTPRAPVSLTFFL